ncbi:MAG: hypothetical protein EBQ72_00555 [Actinobacteria bacterium]|nr:hypothetical protein [Actinomycetota bacterium]
MFLSSRFYKVFSCFLIALLALAPQVVQAKSPKTIKGKATYFWEVDRKIDSAILADTAYFKFYMISTTLTYDVTEIATGDQVAIELGSKKVSTGASLSKNGGMLISLEINGEKIPPGELMGASDLMYTKVAGDTSVKVTIVQQPKEFSSTSAKQGKFGEVRIVPTVTITRMVEDLENPGEYIPQSDATIEVDSQTAGVSGLETIFTVAHYGTSVTLPANATGAFGDVEWQPSGTLAKNTKITATNLKIKRIAPGQSVAKNVPVTWCDSKNNFCRSKPADLTKGYFSLGATNASGSIWLEAKGNTLKLKFATKKVSLSQGVSVRSGLTQGTVLSMDTITVTK